MYHAIMKYAFKPEKLQEATKIWEEGVAGGIVNQPGFIRVQFYTEPSGEAIAIGSWESKEHADAFMKTGVFADILKTFEDCMQAQPRGGAYTLEYFAQV